MSRIVQVTESNDYAVTSSSNPLNLTTSNLANGYDDFNGSNYASITLKTGSNAESYFYFTFSPNIPIGSTINSVSCYARTSLTSTSGISTRTLQLCSGTTGKGDVATLTASTSGVTGIDLASGTSWTASEINNASLYLYAKRGTSNVNTARYFRFYGATLTVNYTYDKTQYEVTATSSVQGVSVSSSQAWVNSGEDYDLDITGDITNADVTDNDNDIKSSLSVIGTNEYRYSIVNIAEDHSIVIAVHIPSGDIIYIKVNGTWEEAQDVKVKVNGTWQSVSKAYKKENGAWEEQDKSAMFDQDALYLKG